MKHVILSFGIIVVFSNILFSQDIIIKKNGDELNAKVLEVGDLIVKYKIFENIEGPTYDMNKSEIFMIKYQNGTKDVFNSETPIVQQPAPPINNVNTNVSKKIKVAGNAFYFNGIRQNDISVMNVMRMNGDEKPVMAYKKAWGLQRAGSPLIAIGIPTLVLGVLITSLSSSNTTVTTYSNGVKHTSSANNSSLTAVGVITTLLGTGLTVTGIVFKVNGKKKKAMAVESYNKKFE